MVKEKATIFKRVADVWVKIFAFVLFAAVSINFLEIVMRVFFSASVDLFYDLPAWLTTWSMLMVAGIILLDNEHLCIEALRNQVKGKGGKFLDTVNNLLTILFGAVITYSGIIYVEQLYSFNTVFTRVITIPRWLVELCVPLGMGIFTLCAVIKLVADVRKKLE